MIGKSLEARLTRLQQVVAVAITAAFGASMLWLTLHVLAREEHAYVVSEANRIARRLQNEVLEEGDLRHAATGMIDEESGSGLKIDVTDGAGHLLASSMAVAPTKQAADANVEVETAAAHCPCGAWVHVSLSSRFRRATLASLTYALFLSAIPILAVGLLAGRWTVRRAIRPLKAMEAEARAAAAERGTRSLGNPSGLAEIDSLREAFNRLLVRLEDALQAERRFTAEASHELRTPMTALSGELELALARTAMEPELRAGLTRALDQVVAMREVVDALLLLRRIRNLDDASTEFEMVNLSDVALDVMHAVRARHPARSTDVKLSAPDEVLVTGHPALLAAALRNLVDNAIQFTAAGDAVQVSIAQEREAHVQVDDAGNGLAPGESSRVFDPFYRGAEARATEPGSGLGLTILRQIIEAHGGTVHTAGSPLGGARFAFSLPLWKP
ncbi:MAG TPA: HAMP domain-containing sensor histidine kinase [Candidatus Eisenbacteria bacterium]